MTPKNILKSAGDTQLFSRQKLLESLYRADIDRNTAEEIVSDVIKTSIITSTDDLHHAVFERLKKKKTVYAAKYNLRRAITHLGPSGYPFEQFVARLLTAKGYSVKTNQILQGECVSHEADVVGFKGKKHYLFECKFHNKTGYKSSIQTVLYMKSRYEDIRSRWDKLENKKHLHKVWIVTNTKFTTDARKYAKCIGMGLISWRYPEGGGSLANLIEETGLHPVTAITS